MYPVYGGPLYEMGTEESIMLPGSRLEVGPKGHLYETLGNENALKQRANADAQNSMAEPNQKAAAARELARMRRSLKGWLKFRQINDDVAAGKIKARIPTFLAQKTLHRDRDYAGEQKLADDLYLLLSRIYDPKTLPSANVSKDPNAAVKLALIAINDKPPEVKTATGIWPILILTVGAVFLFTITSYISNRAEVQKEKERTKCIQSGACTDYGFWLKAAGVIVVGYFVWEKLGVGERVKGLIKGR
ncbi:MAG: hypothetical protein ACE5LB_13785 [Acidiferrobacterales bacterium]